MQQPLKWYTIRPWVFTKVILIGALLIMYVLPLALVPISIFRGAELRYTTNPPAIIVYDDIIPDGAGGAARAYVVYIRPENYGEPMVLYHELKHVEQWYKSLGLCKYYYAWSWKYRLMYEYEAYIEGLKYSEDLEYDLVAAAAGLSHPSYKLNIDPMVSYMLLEQGINKYHRGIE